MEQHASLQQQGRAALDRARSAAGAFKRLPADSDFAAVALAFDRITEPLNGIGGRIHLYSQVHPDEEVREEARGLEQELAAFETELSLDRELYERLAALRPEEAPGAEEGRVLEHSLRDFRRSGVDRDEESRARVRELQEELVRIGQEFDKNIVAGGRDFIVPEGHAGLAGLPADFLAAHPEREDGSVVLTIDPQDRLPVMTYAESGELRRTYSAASQNRAHPENAPVLERLLRKRHELAQVLGYANYADYVTEDKMMKSGAAARDFIERVAELARPRAEAELADLLEEKRRGDPQAERVEAWERFYLTERVKRQRYGFDSQSVRPYFAYGNVRDGVLATSAALYGVEFARNAEVPCWHPDVECYDVLEGGERVARFYFDMHPRPGKYKHAAMFGLAHGLAGGTQPEACLVCNFPRPTGDNPALLEHDQVTTFFHEFGHLLHNLFGGRQRFLRFSGIATEWDFVEVPSQMYEEWAWDAGVLGAFATHHETGEPIPAELVARMRAADEYGKGLQVAVQMFYAMLSLSYYDRDPEGLDVTGHMVAVKERFAPFPHEEDTHMHLSFGHLHGYSAIYYTYMWSLVIAKDLFSRFHGDLMNAETAGEYRRSILEPGGTRDAGELVQAFLGREHGFGAFESWLNQ